MVGVVGGVEEAALFDDFLDCFPGDGVDDWFTVVWDGFFAKVKDADVEGVVEEGGIAVIGFIYA